MSDQENKSSWFKNIASVFVEFDSKDESPTTKSNAGGSSTPLGSSNPSRPVVAAMPAPVDFIEELKLRFKKVIDDKNQPGFDFYEFSVMLLRSSTSPSGEQFKTAFEGAKMLNPSCNKDFLLTSAQFYKNELQAAYQATIQTGEQKKGSIEVEKTNEQKQLTTDLSNIDQQLTTLKKQIQDLEAKRNEKSSALQSIDQKYVSKLAEIEGKMNATATAKDGVLADILLIEDGVKNFL